MAIITRIPSGWDADLIHEISDTQQLLGPARARILVHNEPDHSPYDLELKVALDGDRYVVTHLEVISNRWADTAEDVANLMRATGRPPSEDDHFTPSKTLPPITATGLLEIKLPPILRKALRPEVKARRLLSNGEWSTGITEEDLVPTTYLIAQLVGDNPTAAVAEELGISRQTAAQRVARARKAGLIPPAKGKGAR